MPQQSERHLAIVGGHEPTEATRELVRSWTDIGAGKELIARELRIHVRALDHHYRDELAGGDARGVARVAAALYKKAVAGDVAAQVYFLKTRGRRAGWVDREEEQRNQASQLDVVNAVLKTVALLKGGVTVEEPAAPVASGALAPRRRLVEHQPPLADDDGHDLL